MLQRKIPAILVLCFLVTPASFAQEKPPTLPPPEVKRTVNALVGRWKLEATMTVQDGKPTKFKQTLECAVAALGHAVTCVDRSDIPEVGRVEYSWLAGYDAAGKAVHIFIIGSPGEVVDHKCSWQDDKLLACRSYRGKDASQVTEEVSFTFHGDVFFMKAKVTTDAGETLYESVGKRAQK
jgi:hypothetical protein